VDELIADTFVHEGITTGLKGGRLILDDEDLETMQDSIDHQQVALQSASWQQAAKMATAPIRLAVSLPKWLHAAADVFSSLVA
jgi:hypothetical protein